jgi:GNAT superfamily N-acetyltransferase
MPPETAPLFRFRPVTRENLADLVAFSESHGKFRYCSCMRWRLRSTDFAGCTAEDRARRLEDLVKTGTPVGVLAYVAGPREAGTSAPPQGAAARGRPVGWCSVAPRETYAGLERYKALARVDDASVWSVTCFFVDRNHRRQALTLGLLRAAVEFAAASGARVVEGYPVEPGTRLYTYMGAPSTFQRAGFKDVTPPGRDRRVMRIQIT